MKKNISRNHFIIIFIVVSIIILLTLKNSPENLKFNDPESGIAFNYNRSWNIEKLDDCIDFFTEDEQHCYQISYDTYKLFISTVQPQHPENIFKSELNINNYDLEEGVFINTRFGDLFRSDSTNLKTKHENQSTTTLTMIKELFDSPRTESGEVISGKVKTPIEINNTFLNIVYVIPNENTNEQKIQEMDKIVESIKFE